jgi:hypothetical protein
MERRGLRGARENSRAGGRLRGEDAGDLSGKKIWTEL